MDQPGAQAATLEDAELARRIASRRGGTRAEEAELCRRYSHRLVRFGMRHLRSAERAQDLAQDALVVTLEKLRAGEVREPDKVGSFILGVARQLSRSTDRDRRRYRSIDADTIAAPTVDATESPPLGRADVTRCLEALGDRARTVLVLTYYADETTAGIASSLGLTEGNVRVLRHRGMARLRSCLGLGPEEERA